MLYILPAPSTVASTLCWVFIRRFSVLFHSTNCAAVNELHDLLKWARPSSTLKYTTKTFIDCNLYRFNGSWALTLYLRAECDPLLPLTGLSLYSSLSSWGGGRHRLMDGEWKSEKKGLSKVSDEQRDWTQQQLEKSCRKMLKYLKG